MAEHGRDDLDLIGIGFLLTWEKLDRIETKLDKILKLERQEMNDLTQLSTEVAQNTDVISSAVDLLGKLAEEIRAAGTDQAALDALASQLDANSQTLAEAIAANTPAAPEPPA